jgi:hypothetical protein
MRAVDSTLASLLLAAARAGSSMARVWPRRRKMAGVLVTRPDPSESLA